MSSFFRELNESHLAQFLQTPYGGWLYRLAAVTSAILNLDPL